MEQQPFIFSALLFTVSFLTPFCSCSDIKVKVIKNQLEKLEAAKAA